MPNLFYPDINEERLLGIRWIEFDILFELKLLWVIWLHFNHILIWPACLFDSRSRDKTERVPVLELDCLSGEYSLA